MTTHDTATPAERRRPRRLIGRRHITWTWLTQIEDHGDGTCTVLAHYRAREPSAHEHGWPIEDDGRIVREICVGVSGGLGDDTVTERLKVRNPGHVFGFGAGAPLTAEGGAA